MVLNQGAFRILSSTAFDIVKSQREEKEKSIISGDFFFIFKFFAENLEVDFGINLNKYF